MYIHNSKKYRITPTWEKKFFIFEIVVREKKIRVVFFLNSKKYFFFNIFQQDIDHIVLVT